MAWALALQGGPSLTVNTVNCITWNEATHQMMQLPGWIDLMYDAEAHNFALIGRRDSGQYRIVLNADNTYQIKCPRALNQMGMKDLAADYTVTPISLPVDPTPLPGEPPAGINTRVNGIYAPVKP